MRLRWTTGHRNQDGSLHYILPLAVIAICGIVGAGLIVASHADASDASTAKPVPWGLFQTDNNLKYSLGSHTPKFAIQYYGWQELPQLADMKAAWKKGTTSFLEMQTCGDPCDATTAVQITSVTSGKYDTYLKQFAAQLASFKHPVLLTFDHEMNGDWYSWGDGGSGHDTPSQWIAAWQHVTTVIDKRASNVSWVWAPNIESTGVPSFSPYWPGQKGANPHVTYVGLDGYLPSSSNTWSNTLAPSVKAIKNVSGGKPFMVTETGVNSGDSNYLSQINSLVSGARSSGAKALLYFDKDGSQGNWQFTSAGQARFLSDVK